MSPSNVPLTTHTFLPTDYAYKHQQALAAIVQLPVQAVIQLVIDNLLAMQVQIPPPMPAAASTSATPSAPTPTPTPHTTTAATTTAAPATEAPSAPPTRPSSLEPGPVANVSATIIRIIKALAKRKLPANSAAVTGGKPLQVPFVGDAILARLVSLLKEDDDALNKLFEFVDENLKVCMVEMQNGWIGVIVT